VHTLCANKALLARGLNLEKKLKELNTQKSIIESHLNEANKIGKIKK
jgi:hypothetical protein